MLSKSRFMAGLQCHKQRWWTVHEPHAPELTAAVPASLRDRFAQAEEVGRVARDYVEGAQYEASFHDADTQVVVDILDGTTLVEVKATNRVKKEHIPDLAIQAHVLRQAGLPITRMEVMHLNPACRFPNLGNLFVREDVSEGVELYLPTVPDAVRAQLAALAGPIPQVPIGEHCTRPHPCPFLKRCWPTLPAHHVSTLYSIPRQRVEELQEQGYETLHDLPSDVELSAIHARQVKAVTTGQPVVEASLAGALVPFEPPLAFLDFETVSFAIPRYPACAPWETMPVQFSVHRETPAGKLTHDDFLVDGQQDPRPRMVERLVEACRGAKSVVAYSPFERECLDHLATAVPRFARELHAISARLVDLLPTVRNHVYHPDFGGSFSIKHVLPALVPGVSYDDLQVVTDADSATVALRRIMLDQALEGEERGRLRRALLAYCERDTWAMVKLLERLRALAGGQGLRQLELF